MFILNSMKYSPNLAARYPGRSRLCSGRNCTVVLMRAVPGRSDADHVEPTLRPHVDCVEAGPDLVDRLPEQIEVGVDGVRGRPARICAHHVEGIGVIDGRPLSPGMVEAVAVPHFLSEQAGGQSRKSAVGAIIAAYDTIETTEEVAAGVEDDHHVMEVPEPNTLGRRLVLGPLQKVLPANGFKPLPV